MSAKKVVNRGRFVVVSDADADLLDGRRWTAMPQGATFVARRPGRRGHFVVLHRAVMQRALGRPLRRSELVEPRNGNALDCRRANLRLVEPVTVAQRLPLDPRNTSGFRGVSWSRALGLWRAVAQVANERRHLGYYRTARAAGAAADAWRKEQASRLL
jgi:uncharacterized protein YfaA (DUF2138 family)